MKCRCGHVTNSSSSSFIIAKHKDFKTEDIKTALNNMRDNIEWLLKNYGEYIYFEDNEKMHYLLKTNQIKEAIDLTIFELEDRLYSFANYSSLILDCWECSSQEFSDEDGDLLGLFLMYCRHGFKCDTLKIG